MNRAIINQPLTYYTLRSCSPFCLSSSHGSTLRMWWSVAWMDVCFNCLNCSEELEETYQYCSRCGATVDIEEVLIRHYFQRGFDHSVILLFLEKYHATEMSVRTSHNRLREYGLRRRNANSYDAEIYQAIQQQLDRPGCMRGYRARWHTLRLDYGIQAPRRNFTTSWPLKNSLAKCSCTKEKVVN